MTNKVWKTAIGCLVGASLMTACGSNAGDGKNGGGAATAPSGGQKASSEPVELIFQDQGGAGEEVFNQSYGSFIKKKFPNYTIKFIQATKGSTLQDLIVAGQHVDIIIAGINGMPDPLFGLDMKFDMTDLVKKHGVDLTKFEPTLIDGIKTMGDGKLYFLPVTNLVQVMFYNKGIFDKFGVPYPKDGMTWDEVGELNRKMTRSEGGVSYMGYSASPAHILNMSQYSMPLYDPKTKKPVLTDERWRMALETYFLNNATAGYKEWATAKKKLPYYTEMTSSQELAMMVFNSQFPFDGPQYVKDINWDLVSLPVLKDKPKLGSQANPKTFAITKTSKNKDAAMEVIKYMISPEMQMNYSKQGYMTVLNDDGIKKAIGSESQHKGKNWSAVYYNSLAPMAYKSIYDTKILSFLTPNVLKVVTGETDLNSAIRSAQEQADKYLESEMKK
ncbi:extracellular solute-binding protein [Paenibacillus mesophilus]|uniref:ABC transporter substrate-binding protein n=1 Tax=Paenibacillus mesophilus TaxID=2582849 RepID=UPI00110E33E8|nr:extracellular solute-binding protein [Paenibacillus mesophilus]TMV47395.1 extracellular solute-binding protein [Paenibacillus mesophilus]